jgi:lipoate-protein ligase A
MTEPNQVVNISLDEDLIEQVRGGVSWTYRLWEPEQVVVVLGRSNKAAVEVYEQRCQEDGIPILRRRGGGGTVVLSPGILVISLVKQVQRQFFFQEYFWQINSLIIAALEHLGIQNLSQQGFSDICLQDRKILGSSMYGSKNLIFYTASLMVANDLALIDRYLKHPSQEPDYRRGRSHQEFLTTINQIYPGISIPDIKTSLDTVLAHAPPPLFFQG